jgi:dTDP-4-amino-4,6-dideoxygalactose transaminase
MIYYKIPIHLQKGYLKYGGKESDFPISEAISGNILSLPMHPYLNQSDIDRVLDALENSI